MALTTDVTPEGIAVSLARSAPIWGSLEYLQWVMWTADALRFIQRRATKLAVDDADIVQEDLDYVVREAVVAQVRMPDDWTRGAEDQTASGPWYRTGSGRVNILDEWWELLGLNSSTGKAYNVDMMPPGAGIDGDRETYWWATP